MASIQAGVPEAPWERAWYMSFRSSIRAATTEVGADEDEHLSWARSTKSQLTMLQARSKALADAGALAEELVERIKGWFSS